jgi:hypothetical protein
MDIKIQQNEVNVFQGEEELHEKSIMFTFDPTKIEMVRARDGAYIIREKRPRGEVVISESPA